MNTISSILRYLCASIMGLVPAIGFSFLGYLLYFEMQSTTGLVLFIFLMIIGLSLGISIFRSAKKGIFNFMIDASAPQFDPSKILTLKEMEQGYKKESKSDEFSQKQVKHKET